LIQGKHIELFLALALTQDILLTLLVVFFALFAGWWKYSCNILELCTTDLFAHNAVKGETILTVVVSSHNGKNCVSIRYSIISSIY